MRLGLSPPRRPAVDWDEMLARKRAATAWHWLLVLPFVGLLWVPFYNRREPSLAGFPFFYWYQFVWIGVSAGLTAVVYFATRDERR
jgi:hypothetical protein